MLKTRVKIILPLMGLMLIVFSLSPFGVDFWKASGKALGLAPRESISGDYDLNLYFLPVGKADAIIIQQREKFFLLDGGTVNSAKEIKAYLTRLGAKELEGVFVSHPDSDHLGALSTVLRDFQTKAVYTVDFEGSSEEYYALEQLIADTGINKQYLKAGDSLNFGDMAFDVLSPYGSYSEDNDMSLVIKLSYGSFSALFTGDAGTAAENTMLEQAVPLESDIIKIAHHGSKTASGENFLKAVNPKLAIISTGPDRNRLPDSEILSRLMSLSIPFHRTDLEATLIVSANGEGEFNISTKEQSYAISDN